MFFWEQQAKSLYIIHWSKSTLNLLDLLETPLQVGTCSALSGLCTCPAGWTGFNCLHPVKRYCTHVYREFGFEVPRVPPNLTAGLGPSGITTFQFTKSHCAGEQAVWSGRQSSRQTGRACPALQQAAPVECVLELVHLPQLRTAWHVAVLVVDSTSAAAGLVFILCCRGV